MIVPRLASALVASPLAAPALFAFTLAASVLFDMNGAPPMEQLLFIRNVAVAGGLLVTFAAGAGAYFGDGE